MEQLSNDNADVCWHHRAKHDGTEFRLLLAQGFLYLGLLDKAAMHFQMVAQDRQVRSLRGGLHMVGLCNAVVCAASQQHMGLTGQLLSRVGFTLTAASPTWSPFHELAYWSFLR